MKPAYAVLALLVLWCGLFAALESARTVKTYVNQPWHDELPSQWRPGAEPVARLERFLDAAAVVLPRGARVAFTTTYASGAEADIAAWWAAFLLPEQDVFPAALDHVGRAEYWLVYGTGRPEPGLENRAPRAVSSTPDGTLYRLEAPAP